jgi:sortase A
MATDLRLRSSVVACALGATLLSTVAFAGTSDVPPQDAGLVGRIRIERIGVNGTIREGADDETLRIAVGHIEGTPLPGAGSNVGLAAHRDTFFRPLEKIRKDDLVELTTAKGTFRYRVVATEIVLPTDVQVLDPTPKPSITLVTCYPFINVGPAPQRFIVHAVQVDEPRPAEVLVGTK